MTLVPFAECVKHNSELQSHRVRKVLSEASQVAECTHRRWGSSQCSFVINALCKRYLPQVGNRWEMQLSYRNGIRRHCSTHTRVQLPPSETQGQQVLYARPAAPARSWQSCVRAASQQGQTGQSVGSSSSAIP